MQRRAAQTSAEQRDRPTPVEWVSRLATYPVWGADLDFDRHRARNAETLPAVPDGIDDALRLRLEESRRLALEGGNPLGRRLRVYLPLVIGTLGSLASVGAWIHMGTHWSQHPGDWILFVCLPVGIAQAVATLGFWLYQGLFRESVVRHEARQVLVTLVGGGVASEEAGAFQERLRLAWRLRRVQDTGLALLCLATPFVGVPLSLTAFLRSAGSLTQHTLHEESLEREAAQGGPG